MPLSWNEIKSRATTFAKEWENETSEDAEAKSFWDDFFNVFGISRRRVASFEQQVKKIDDKTGFIDLLWKGVILIEHKSRGRDLDRAYQQAKDYFPGLKDKELPRYILVSDFERFRLYDLEENQQTEFKLTDFVNHVHLFGFIAGYQKRSYKEQDPVNIEAAELMGQLHDKLKAIGYDGHQLELYLVRLLFLLFADDTNIFERGIFNDYLELKTNEDGSDLAAHLSQLFEILNSSKDKRLKNLDESLAAFPYVNGKLFEEHLPLASFDSEMRRILLDCCLLDWGKISPAIFGSLFQSVMDSKARRNLGAHYTSEKNILKLIKPLFLDDLWKEFEAVKDSKAKLQKFHDKLSKLRFLDPACGCGNFLIIAYREIRLLEIEIIKTLLFKHEKLRIEVAADAGIDVGQMIKCDVDRFYGIEYEEFPAQIAQVAMWLIDHQMNQMVSNTFGEYYVRLPLRKSATIKHGNALRIDWNSLIDPMPWEKEEIKYDYILGNPPFVGAKVMNENQRADMNFVAANIPSSGLLDYVTAWYILAHSYICNHSGVCVAFVSTNSITQGEQVSILWPSILMSDVAIDFAYRSFVWTNEARNVAKVHCVIIGLSREKKIKKIYTVDSSGAVIFSEASNINPYLIDYRNIFLPNRSEPVCKVPEITTGNKPIDNGLYIFDEIEKDDFVRVEPNSIKYFKKFIGALEFINGSYRWILDLRDAQPNDLRSMPKVLERIQKVKEYRESSDSLPTKKLALKPTRFHTEFNTDKPYLILPEVSSERRKYMPIGYSDFNIVPSNKLRLMPYSTIYHFAVLTSIAHNNWIKAISGRMKSDISYSVKLAYNNFPWPENPTDKQKEAVEKAAQTVLDTRAQFSNSSLADLYDPNTMPPELVKAHQVLDKAVDLCYRSQPFPNETKRIEFLFELYDKYTAGLFVKEKKK